MTTAANNNKINNNPDTWIDVVDIFSNNSKIILDQHDSKIEDDSMSLNDSLPDSHIENLDFYCRAVKEKINPLMM